MGRINASEAEHYGSQGGAGFFSLKDDKDTARVRFMYNGVEDIEAFAVHELKSADGKRRTYVNCLRDYRQPLDVCPFCREHIPQTVKLFIPLYNVDEEKVQIWERGKKYINKLTSVCSRYAKSDTPLCANIFEIERNGKKGEQTTTYENYQIEKDNTTLDDLPEVPDPLGTIVKNKTADDMETYLETGSFPPDDDDEDSAPVRRQSREEETTYRRRTPGRSNRDVY